MERPVTTFWAKLRPYGGAPVESWHPLTAHCADVAACLEALLSLSITCRRLAHLGGVDDLSLVQVDRLCVLAALHDLGKYNIGFQNKKLCNPPFTAGHVGEALAAFGSRTGSRIGEALEIGTFADWGETDTTFEDLLVTALGHHGRPVPPRGRPTPGAWEPTEELDPFEGISELRAYVQQWYPRAFAEDGEPLPESTGFQHAFNGVLTLADWIGSNERFFSYAEELGADRIEFARSRASEALEHMGIDPRRARAGLVERPPRFRQVWGFQPRPAQRDFEELPTDGGPQLSILEAPTGSGKTEAALIRFLRLFSAGEVDGLYFALPTRAAASQMHDRVRAMLRKVVPDADLRPPVVLAVPGYLADDGREGALLDERGALWTDDDRRCRYRTWASERPKRYLAGAVAVGTVDQVLLAGLAVDHSHLRAAALLRHLLVVDEVHASDPYMARLLERVLERHMAAGGHAVLMSATLGESARSRYVALGRKEGADLRPLEEARQFHYPVVVRGGPTVPTDIRPVEAIPLSEKRVEVELVAAMEHPDQVSRRALRAAQEGARVLTIRNTVAGCRALQRSLEDLSTGTGDPRLFRCVGVAAPHHSRFARTDRRLLDRAVESAFGGDRSSEGTALAATQTVEQSLDIDADLLVTDLCPADVLLQRIGRLHRHERSGRPPDHEVPRVVVLVPDEADLGRHILDGGQHAGRARGPHGIGTVYEDLRVLVATWHALRSRRTLHLPDESRHLVEAATHPHSLQEIVEERGDTWGDHARTMEGVRQAEQAIAGLNLADWSARFGDPDSLFPDNPGERVRTRLGEGDRRAILDEPVSGPFGKRIREWTIPEWMAPDAAYDAAAEVERAAGGEVVFRFGSRLYRYDRWGLRKHEGDGAA